MEMRGELRRGYFVAGLSGLQFALPEAVEELRAVAAAHDDSPVVLNATDPANLYGSEVGAPIPFARLPSTHVVLIGGQPLLVAEDSGKRIKVQSAANEAVISGALEVYLARAQTQRRIVVEQWNDEPVLGSAGENILRTFGFQRTPSGMEKWRAS
jgi:ATP-dependent Lhr-like helicase